MKQTISYKKFTEKKVVYFFPTRVKNTGVSYRDL